MPTTSRKLVLGNRRGITQGELRNFLNLCESSGLGDAPIRGKTYFGGILRKVIIGPQVDRTLDES